MQGIILFKEKAKEALDKAKDANNGNLQLRNKEVTWEILDGDTEKEALKKIIEDQQESLNKWKSKGPVILIFLICLSKNCNWCSKTLTGNFNISLLIPQLCLCRS